MYYIWKDSHGTVHIADTKPSVKKYVEVATLPEGDGWINTDNEKVWLEVTREVTTVPDSDKIEAILDRQEFLEDVIAEIIQNSYSE